MAQWCSGWHTRLTNKRCRVQFPAGVKTLGKFLHKLIAYVDPALIGNLDVRRLASRILGTWRRCGVVDNISYVQVSAQALVIIHCPHLSTATLSNGWGV